MGLFYRRPLCLFCFFFALSAGIAWRLPMSWLPWILGTLVTATATVAVLVLARKGRQTGRSLLPLLLSLIFVCVSLGNLLLSVDLPQKRRSGLAGEGRVAMEILDVEAYGYQVRLLQVEEQSCSVKAQMNLSTDVNLSVGDRVLCRATLRPVTDLMQYRAEQGILYHVYPTSQQEMAVSEVPRDATLWELIQTVQGRHALTHRIRTAVCSSLTDSLGQEAGALCGGFLMGDTSLLPPETVRDFRRSGTSHLMAISGMHIAVLMGSADWLLRRLYLPKKLRCGAVSILALLFLLITGFASSACRSVLMLLFVYLAYLFHEENDSLTALFGSVTVILLISPYALTDLGLWMSFFATLGLLTVYPLLERRIPRPRARVLRVLRVLLMILLMTLVANAFLLPILWGVFGELSWVAPLANLPLSPMADLLLVGVIPFLLLGGIPLLGDGLAYLLRGLGEGFVDLLQLFSRIPYGVVSLRYGFCYVLIPLFTLSMAVLLVLRLKRKGWLALPPVATLLAFLICLGAYHGIHREAQLTRWEVGRTGEEILLSEQGSTLWVLDSTSGGYGTCAEVRGLLNTSLATEIRSYTLEKYGNTEGITLLLRSVRIRTLCLPTPKNAEEAEKAKAIYRVANHCGTQVTFEDS